ncbi:MAG: hypothetical protein AAGG02_18730, partial [Cyanobacteria bacterium P01_H01_bin.15]
MTAATVSLSSHNAPLTAYFFVVHGSRDPRAKSAIVQLCQQIQTILYLPDFQLGWAALELAEQSLHQ